MNKPMLGPYQLDEEIGQGQLSIVYAATDTRSGRDLALKLLPADVLSIDSYRERIRESSALIARFSHSSVVPVYDMGKAGDQYYIAMRRLSGRTLHDTLPLPYPNAIRTIHRLGEALHEAHRRGLVHGNLRPSKILYDELEAAYLSGFGLPTIHEIGRRLSASGLLSRMAYLSPEQLDPQPKNDIAADIYTLGLLLHEMLSGQPAFTAADPRALIALQQQQPLPLLSEQVPNVPTILDAVLASATAKNPADRYPTISAMLSEMPQPQNTAFNVKSDVGIQPPTSPQQPDADEKSPAFSLRNSRIAMAVVGLLMLGCFMCLAVASMLFLPTDLRTNGAAPLETVYISSQAGINITMPAGWQMKEAPPLETLDADVLMLAASASPDTTDAFFAGVNEFELRVSQPVVTLMFLPSEGLPVVATSPPLMLRFFTSELPLETEIAFGRVRQTNLNGTGAAFTDFSSGSGEAAYAGRIAAINNGGYVGIIAGVAPADQWSDFAPTFNAMLESMGFIDPILEIDAP